MLFTKVLKKRKLYLLKHLQNGKTISTTFPAVKAIGEGYADRIIYGTARTTTQEMAENAFNTMCMNGLNMRFVTITAKKNLF